MSCSVNHYYKKHQKLGFWQEFHTPSFSSLPLVNPMVVFVVLSVQSFKKTVHVGVFCRSWTVQYLKSLLALVHYCFFVSLSAIAKSVLFSNRYFSTKFKDRLVVVSDLAM